MNDRFSVPDLHGSGLGPVAYRPEDDGDAARAIAETALLAIDGVCGIGEGRDDTGAPAWVCYVVDRAAAARVPPVLAGRHVVVEMTGEIDIHTR